MASTYYVIDGRSFYATVECVARGLDPLKTNLVVADPDRSQKLPGSFAEHEGTWRQEPVPDSGHTRQYRVHCCPTTDAAVH